ncbi:MAG: CoA transferase [bacterium]|nr:CoA transferase [bacterium]
MRPLESVRVVTLATNVPGPLAAARLHALGAAVTKIEPPAGDLLARVAPRWYTLLHDGVEVLRVDLHLDAQRAILERHLAHADLLLTSSRPSALARWGLSWGESHPAHPRLVHVAIVGHLSPRAESAGHDLTYQAEAGLLEPPRLPRTLLADLAGAERAVSTALALLLARERTGAAEYAEVSLAETARELCAPLRYGLTAAGGMLGGGWPHYGIYRAREGWVALANVEKRFQERFLRELGIGEESQAAFAAALSQRTAAEWEAWGKEHGLPVAAVMP